MQTLRIFLQQLIPAMEFGTALLTPLAVLLAILISYDGGSLIRTFKKAAYRGFWFSVFLIAVKQGTRNAVSREIVEGIMAFFAIISEIGLVGVLLGSQEKFSRRAKFFGMAVMVLVIALSVYYGMEIWLIPVTTILNVEEILSLDMAVRILGFFTGLAFSVLK